MAAAVWISRCHASSAPSTAKGRTMTSMASKCLPPDSRGRPGVALCIVAGIALGAVIPGVFQALGRLEVAQVDIPVALLIWLMIVPMLLRVDFGAMGQVTRQWRGI